MPPPLGRAHLQPKPRNRSQKSLQQKEAVRHPQQQQRHQRNKRRSNNGPFRCFLHHVILWVGMENGQEDGQQTPIQMLTSDRRSNCPSPSHDCDISISTVPSSSLRHR